MSATRKTATEHFASKHRRESRYAESSVDKSAPAFHLNDHFNRNGYGLNLFSTSHTADRVAYNQFKRWTYVSISAIARRLAGFEFCAGEVKNAAPNPDRARSKGWYKAAGQTFSKYALSPAEIKSLPKSVRSYLGGTSKVPAGSVEIIDQHPVLDLLMKPNHVQKQHEFIFCMVASLYLTGEAYLIGGEDSESETNTTIWAIPSTWVDVEHKDGLFTGYRLRAGDMREAVKVPEGGITRIYYPDPSDPKKVISPVQANLQAILTDEALQTAHKTSFDQGIFPKLAISVGRNIDATGKLLDTRPVMTEVQREQLISAVADVWMSTAADGLPAILDGLIEDVKVLQNTPVEMDYMNSSKLIKERIFQAFGLNPIIVGEITASNKAQALVAERSFQRNVLQPLADQISVCLTDWLGPWYEQPKRLVIWLTKDEPADEDLVVKKWQEARRQNDVTQEEYRMEMFGLEPIADDDREESRSALFNNPQAMAALQNTVMQVSTGKIDYDAAVVQIAMFFEVDENEAKRLLGPKPSDDEIEANQLVENPPQPPVDEEDDDESPIEPSSNEEDEDDSALESDDDGKSIKKKRLKLSKLSRVFDELAR